MFLSDVDVASKNLAPLAHRLKHEKKLLSSGLMKTIFGYFWVTSVGSEAQITYNKRNKTTKQWSSQGSQENSIAWFLRFFCDDGTRGTDFLHSRIPNYFCQTAIQPKKSSFSVSYFITVNFLFVAYVEDSVDSSSIVTNQLEEPTSPLDSSTKSVDELLQVFMTLLSCFVLRMLTWGIWLQALHVWWCSLFCCFCLFV